MDSQTLLIIVIALLSLNLLFVGFYIVLILKEVRTSVTKMNAFLDTVNEVSTAVADPIVGASGAMNAFTQGVKAFGIIKKFVDQKKSKSGSGSDGVEETDE